MIVKLLSSKLIPLALKATKLSFILHQYSTTNFRGPYFKSLPIAILALYFHAAATAKDEQAKPKNRIARGLFTSRNKFIRYRS